jgi:putative DNA primase/helicase
VDLAGCDDRGDRGMSVPPDDEPDDFGPEGYGELAGEPGGEEPSRLRVVKPDEESPFVVKGRKIAATVGNAVIMLVAAKEWAGLRFDKFRGEPSILLPPRLPGFDPPNSRLDGYAASYIAHWLGRCRGLLISEDQAYRAAEYASKAVGRAFHPVREYLKDLEWDGVRRLDTFVPVYLGGDKSIYTAAVWRCWMISGVARVMQPGCQVHHVPILEGKQGSGKSSAVRALMPNPKWMNDSPVKIGDKDGMDALRGHWVVEFGELESMADRAVAKIKAFVTSAVDTFRKAYGKDTEKFPRQCVMIGTVNPEEGYLRDTTGNRRFWPIKTGAIDFKAIERDRDQLWAEAFVRFTDGEPWHFEGDELIAMATEEQASRTVVDPWEETITAWLSHPLNGSKIAAGITTTDVLTSALSVPVKEQGPTNASRVGTILRQHGFHTRGSSRPRKYYRTTDQAAPADDFGPDDYE